MKNPLLDKEFLYELNQFQHKDIYARIIVLNFDEMPLEQIEGKVISGSINIDGNSAVRRTCNLSLVAKDVDINNFYWSIGSKFTLEVGVNNVINNEYPDIIWFKQGIFVIGSFNSSLSGNNYSISIGGKDKMCLLNGDMGGSLPASIDFGKIDTYNNSYKPVSFNVEDYTQYEANKYYTYDKDKKTDREKDKYEISIDEFDFEQDYYEKESVLTQDLLTIENIIREAVHTYGKEPYSNIIINDLSDYGLELMEYRGDETLYLFFNINSNTYDQMITQSNADIIDIYFKGENKANKITDLNESDFNSLVDGFNKGKEFTFEPNGKNFYTVAKIEYGDATGYRPTDLVYAGELISSIGESLTSILDKIKNMLGAFEYFYDIDGRFIFQAKKIYAQNSWNTLQEYNGTVYAQDAVDESPYSYSFEDVNLIQKFSNQPALNNLKNDYSVWGVRKSATGAEIPIHSRYAIHKKPTYYKNFDGKIFCSDLSIFEEVKQAQKDEIIKDLNNRILNFEPKYRDSMPEYLDTPWRNKDGSWTPGWWDIRDWHDYYVALRQEEPNYSMKEYSRNDSQGCQKFTDIFGNNNQYRNRYVWLIIIESDGKINIQHGSGNPVDQGRWCFRYQSEYDENGELFTYWLDLDGNKHTNYIASYTDDNSEQARERLAKQYNISIESVKWFIPPYCGCSNDHTYLEFLENDIKTDGSLVYFYNPNFPGVASFEDAVQDQVDKEYQEMIDSGLINLVDWREIIYQMALDYFEYNQDPDFAYRLTNNNMKFDKSESYYPNGITEYEMFYTDMQGFWRQLYNYNLVLSSKYELIDGIKKFNDSDLDRLDQINKLNLELAQPGLPIGKQQEILKSISEIKKQMEYITYEIDQGEYINQVFYEITDLKQQIIDNLKISEKIEQQEHFFVYVEKDDDPDIEGTEYRKKEFIPLLNSDIKAGNTYFTNSISIRDDNNNLKEIKDQRWQQGVWWKNHKWIGEPISNYILPFEEENESLWYWNRNVVKAPELLNFWIDFYNIESEIGQYGISIIGDRPKVVNNSKITSIYFRSVPQVIFVYGDTTNLDRKTGYTYVQLNPSQEDLFTISSRGKSAEEETNELFNKHSYSNESISITTIPIYNLEANTLIYIHNDENNINGKYQISKITVPLAYNGTMSISATKIIDPII